MEKNLKISGGNKGPEEPTFTDFFVTGILIFFVVKEINKKTTKLLKSMINLAAFLTFFVARYFDILLFDSGSNSWFWVLTYFVFLVSQIDGQIFTQKFKKLRIIGDLSYSVFLWHIPIQVFIKVVLHDSEIRDSYANSNLFFCFLSLGPMRWHTNWDTPRKVRLILLATWRLVAQLIAA